MNQDQKYKIEKNIPFGKPKGRKKTVSEYPFNKMMSGDSFLVEGDAKKIQSFRMRLQYFKKTTHMKYIYKTRITETGVRVWCLMKDKK
jgi:hypothetical protein